MGKVGSDADGGSGALEDGGNCRPGQDLNPLPLDPESSAFTGTQSEVASWPDNVENEPIVLICKPSIIFLSLFMQQI